MKSLTFVVVAIIVFLFSIHGVSTQNLTCSVIQDSTMSPIGYLNWTGTLTLMNNSFCLNTSTTIFNLINSTNSSVCQGTIDNNTFCLANSSSLMTFNSTTSTICLCNSSSPSSSSTGGSGSSSTGMPFGNGSIVYLDGIFPCYNSSFCWQYCWFNQTDSLGNYKNYTCPNCTNYPNFNVSTLDPITNVTSYPNSTLSTTNCTYYPQPFPDAAVANSSLRQPLCNLTFPYTYSQYDTSQICIVMGAVAKISFFSLVDEFSMLDPAARPGPTINERHRFDSPDMWIQVEIATNQANNNVIVSPPKHRRQADYVVPFWTAIIILDSGIPTDIQWDDGCYGCSGDACIDSTCGVGLYDTCWIGETDCSVKIYVGWFGTDDNDVYLTSSGKRLSRFREFSLNTAFNSATNTLNGNLPNPPQFSGVDFSGNSPNGT